MLKPQQKIYFSSRGVIPPEQINKMSGDLNQVTFLVPIEKFCENDFVKTLKASCSLWIMDIECFSFLLRASDLKAIALLPEIMVFIKGDMPKQLLPYDFPENISFFKYSYPSDVLELQLRQGLKKALKNSERMLEHERYNSLFINSLQAAIILNHHSGEILETNIAAAQLFERDLNDMSGLKFEQLHPQAYDAVFASLDQVLKGMNAALTINYLDTHGRVRELQYRISVIVSGGKDFILLSVDDVTEKGEAYELFYQQAQMLRNTLESIDDLLFSLNREGDFIEYYQPSGGGQLTLSSDVFVGKNIHDVGFPLDVVQKYLDTIAQVIDEDKPEQIDYYMEAFGSRLWYNAKISPRKNIFGIVDGVTVLCRDVTRQKRTEETLKLARDFYLTLLADFPSMIWKTNSAKKADYFNNTWLEFSGRELAQEIKTDWVEKIHINDISNFLAIMNQAYKNKEAFQIEHRMKHHSGEYRWVINAGRPFNNLNGRFEGFIGSCYDISERRKAEEMLYLQRSAMESALEGILIIEDDQKNYPVIYSNNEFTRLTSSTVKDTLGKSFLDVLGCPLNSEIRTNILAALRNKQDYKGEYSCSLPGNGNSLSWFLLYMAPVNDKSDYSNYFVAVLSDITEAKQVEKTLRDKNDQLRKTNEELDSFVYSTSHELRSPLMSVLGLLNLLESDIDHEDRTTYLAMIRESIARLDKIIHDIIEYSRNSRLEVENERIDFQLLIEKIINDHKYFENFDKVKFKVEVKESGPFLSDRKRIKTILNSFISNSLWFHDYAKENPYIEISIKTSSVNAVITVRDNGTGIQDKHLSRIYDMFYRGTEKSKGSGIGLYIVKEIVEKLKGSIDVQSDYEKGTTFTVELPNFINKNYKIISLSESEKLSF